MHIYEHIQLYQQRCWIEIKCCTIHPTFVWWCLSNLSASRWNGVDTGKVKAPLVFRLASQCHYFTQRQEQRWKKKSKIGFDSCKWKITKTNFPFLIFLKAWLSCRLCFASFCKYLTQILKVIWKARSIGIIRGIYLHASEDSTGDIDLNSGMAAGRLSL